MFKIRNFSWIFTISYFLTLTSLHGGIVDLIQSVLTKPIPDEVPSIRVLLLHDQPRADLATTGKYKVYDAQTKELLTTNLKGKQRFIEVGASGIRWGEEFPGIHQIAIIPVDPHATTIVNGKEYHGAILVYDIGGTISIINKVETEDYLNAVLTQHYKESLPSELLAAIAIIVRTTSYFEAQNAKNPYWDVDAKQVGYNGYKVENPLKPVEMAIYKTQYIGLKQANQTIPSILDWKQAPGAKLYQGTTYAAINLEEAAKMARAGNQATEILQKAFPGSSLQFMYQPHQISKG